MTESEWLASTDPAAMLAALRGQNADGVVVPYAGGSLPIDWTPGKCLASDRKLRLFACACWWRFDAGVQPSDGLLVYAIRSVERWADDGRRPRTTVMRGDIGDYVFGATEAVEAVTNSLAHLPGGDRPAQAHLLRDIVGSPFRPAAIDPAWLTPDVRSLALAAYEERGRECDSCRGGIPFSGEGWDRCTDCNGFGTIDDGTLDNARLAVLSDAMEEAGCDDADILSHLRSPGPHVRGCWVVDFCLGRE